MIKNSPPIGRLQERLVRSYLNETFLSKTVDLHVRESVDSTNDYVMSRMDGAESDYLACVASHQTNGRGRNGRLWQSPANCNIYMSIGSSSFSVKNASSLSGLSLACGVSVARILNGMGVQLQLKWPNDILVAGKKLAGILIETRIKASNVFVVVGLGLNVNMPVREAKNIDQPWTDLKSCLPCVSGELDNNWLVSQLISAIALACDSYRLTGMETFLEDWSKYDALKGKEVGVCFDGREVLAQVMGINEDCSLKVEVDGCEKNIYADDVKMKFKK